MNVWFLMHAFALLLGLCLGSFLNVCIARMPEDRSVVHPGSACPHCGAAIRWHDNIPILSWLWLRARCRDCGHPISATYPLIEAATGLLVLLVWIQTVPGVEALDAAHIAAFAYRSVFVCMLVGLTFIDIDHHIIPDEFSIYAVPVGVLGALGLGFLHPGLAPSWQQSLVGALLGAGFLLTVAGAWSLIRSIQGVVADARSQRQSTAATSPGGYRALLRDLMKRWRPGDAMGFGDVKLLAMIGSFLGAFPALFLVMLLASILGSVVGIATMVRRGAGMRLALPFGPFLALGAMIALFFGQPLLRLWLLGLPGVIR